MHTVAIIGRPNVGKSALFNRIVGRRVAIVDPTYGLTRDRITAVAGVGGKNITLVDTGGIDFRTPDDVKKMAMRQTRLAISAADAILLVTDVREGLLPLDEEIASILRKAGKDVIVVANKADNEELAIAASEFHALGFRSVLPVSALHGLGIDSLAKRLTEGMPGGEGAVGEEHLKIAVLGRPNAGKSSFVNAIVCEERMIVHETPGTTRDSVDVSAVWRGRPITLIDTAGAKRERKLREPADFYSFSRARGAVKRCDVALLLLDAPEEVSAQEEKLARRILDLGKGCVIGVNKWDLASGTDPRKYREYVWKKMPSMDFVPVVFLSAKLKKGIGKTLETLSFVAMQAEKKIPTPLLNRVLHDAWRKRTPPSGRGRICKLFYAAQTGVKPVSLTLFVSRSDLLDRAYQRYLDGALRRVFGLEGAPIRIAFRNRRD